MITHLDLVMTETGREEQIAELTLYYQGPSAPIEVGTVAKYALTPAALEGLAKPMTYPVVDYLRERLQKGPDSRHKDLIDDLFEFLVEAIDGARRRITAEDMAKVLHEELQRRLGEEGPR